MDRETLIRLATLFACLLPEAESGRLGTEIFVMTYLDFRLSMLDVCCVEKFLFVIID